jgi:hypothetical protein
MSFSYKTLSSNDTTLTSYIANKQWEVTNTTLSENGVSIYVGENLPISNNYPFDSKNDVQTSNEEYRRLIFNSIKHLFYQNYISGSANGKFFQSSSYFNYEQNTLASGSGISTFRNLSTIEGSINQVEYDTNVIYDSTKTYDSIIFDYDRGGKIVVISIDQKIYGSGLLPNSVFISGSGYYLRDDGEGNLYEWNGKENYELFYSSSHNGGGYFDVIENPELNIKHIGNVFYSHGIIVITNEDYLCVFGVPPSAVNDYFSHFNLNTPPKFDILDNDICDCGTININSFSTSSVEGYTFPNFIYNNGFIEIIPDQSSVIPGNYKIGYTIINSTGLISDTGSINLEITSKPLQIENIISSSICFGAASTLPVTFSINYGVPYYSYSLDNGVTYTGIDKLFNVTVSGSIIASNDNKIYVKDYLGDIVTASFSPLHPAITSSLIINKLPCTNATTDGIITVSSSNATSASIDGGSYIPLPTQFTGLGTGSHTINYITANGCITSSTINLTKYPPLTASVTMSHVNCYGSSTGQININLSNIIDNLSLSLIDPTGSYKFNNIPITSSALVFPNLATGSWTASIFTNDLYGCQNYSNIFTITGSSKITFSTTASYIDSCSNQIIFNAQGGLGGYTYFAQETSTGQSFSSTGSTIILPNTNGGIYNVYVIDTKSCISDISTQEVYGRKYIYIGSYCDTGSAPTTTTTTTTTTITTTTTTTTPFSGYQYNISNIGYYNSATACNALANTFIYRDVPKLEIGDIIYSDSTCTSRLNGGNLWYSISSLYDIAPVIKINSSGVILEVEYCNSGPSGGGCLLEGTEVILSNGEIKEIQDLTLGDKLLSYNIETLPLYSDDPNVITNWNSDNILGTSDITIVKSIKPTVVDKIVNINNILKSSIEHIHLIKRDGIWKFVEAIDVKTNDIMMNNLNEEFIVNNIEIINGVFTVYDIDVEDLDLFYGNGVLTHNNKVPIEP